MATCPIWNTDVTFYEDWDFGGARVESPRAGGRYQISRDAKDALRRNDTETAAKLTTWLQEQHEAGVVAPVINTQVLEAVKSRPRMRMAEKKARFFRELSSRRFRPSDKLKLWGLVTDETKENVRRFAILTEAEQDIDVAELARLLIEQGLLKEETTGELKLTSAGFEQLDQIESAAVGDEAFVAMWFGDATQAAFDAGIAPAIRDAGYRPFRVDRHEHANKIDDEIVAGIRRCRFLVADFTCPVFLVEGQNRPEVRGGVYYEAGLAQGLGRQVIWSVREDCLPYVHFDTRQFAHVVWTDAEDLRKKLFNRISAIIQ